MNEEMREFAEELQDFLKKGHKLLSKMGQGMGQRGGQGYGNNMGQNGFQGMGQNYGQGGFGENVGSWFNKNFGGGQGFDPRYT